MVKAPSGREGRNSRFSAPTTRLGPSGSRLITAVQLRGSLGGVLVLHHFAVAAAGAGTAPRTTAALTAAAALTIALGLGAATARGALTLLGCAAVVVLGLLLVLGLIL